MLGNRGVVGVLIYPGRLPNVVWWRFGGGLGWFGVFQWTGQIIARSNSTIF